MYRVGIIGATGMVGQRFLLLLQNHPWFSISLLCASSRSAGKPYREAVAGRWAFVQPIPPCLADMIVQDAADIALIQSQVDFVFCAVDMKKEEIIALEERLARAEIPVISNNSAHRMTQDVPMLIPELNADHAAILSAQRARLGTTRGFIAVKPNCSIQSYVPALYPLLEYKPTLLSVCTYQAISGAGRTFATWPEMQDNVIPYIGGEDEKSECEPLKVLGAVENDRIIPYQDLQISAQCIRVPVSDGHLAAVSVKFAHKPSREEILARWAAFEGHAQRLRLPSAPIPFLYYHTENDRPQTRLDRDFENGMGISIGRLREDSVFDYKFVCLSHNTVRGAAGGAILMAELLVRKGWIV